MCSLSAWLSRKRAYSFLSLFLYFSLFIFNSLLFFFFCYMVVSIPLFYHHDFINIIKDVKFIYFSLILYALVLINGPLQTAQLSDFDIFLKWNFIIAVTCFSLMYFFNIHLTLNQDSYFKINEVRYMNYGTYVLPIYTIYALANNIVIRKSNWLYIIVPLLILSFILIL